MPKTIANVASAHLQDQHLAALLEGDRPGIAAHLQRQDQVAALGQLVLPAGAMSQQL
jgi:hypothetical protein